MLREVKDYLFDHAESDGLKDYSEYAYGKGRLLLDFEPPIALGHEETADHDTDIYVIFSELMDKFSFWRVIESASTVSVSGSSSGPHTCASTFLDETLKLRIEPDVPFATGETVSVTVNANAN